MRIENKTTIATHWLLECFWRDNAGYEFEEEIATLRFYLPALKRAHKVDKNTQERAWVLLDIIYKDGFCHKSYQELEHKQ